MTSEQEIQAKQEYALVYHKTMRADLEKAFGYHMNYWTRFWTWFASLLHKKAPTTMPGYDSDKWDNGTWK
jgi:hypothetical protein